MWNPKKRNFKTYQPTFYLLFYQTAKNNIKSLEQGGQEGASIVPMCPNRKDFRWRSIVYTSLRELE